MLPFDFVEDNKKHRIALVGGGGKTTLMYELAEHYARVGKKTVVMTTTHIWQPSHRERWGHTKDELAKLWQQNKYAVIGELEAATDKLIRPSQELYDFVLEQADIIICEADGAKQRPIKVPREYEPVIPKESDIVIGLAGLDALGKSWEQVCFGLPQAQMLFNIRPEELVSINKLAYLLTAEQGTCKGIGARDYYIVLNKLDLLEHKAQAIELRKLLWERGMSTERVLLRGRNCEAIIYG